MVALIAWSGRVPRRGGITRRTHARTAVQCRLTRARNDSNDAGRASTAVLVNFQYNCALPGISGRQLPIYYGKMSLIPLFK
jgi:hypothetical protein